MPEGRGGIMEHQEVSRRTLLKGGGAALAGMTVFRVTGPAQAFPGQPDEVLIPWDDPPAPVPEPAQGVIPKQLDWEQLDSWLTPNDEFFIVQHYGQPVLNGQDWRLDVGGLVAHQRTLTLADLKARARREVAFTMECSGNHGPRLPDGRPFFIGGIGNARWAGTPLAPLLKHAGIADEAIEVVFWGADSGQVTIRDNSGVLSGGRTGRVVDDGAGGLD